MGTDDGRIDPAQYRIDAVQAHDAPLLFLLLGDVACDYRKIVDRSAVVLVRNDHLQHRDFAPICSRNGQLTHPASRFDGMRQGCFQQYAICPFRMILLDVGRQPSAVLRQAAHFTSGTIDIQRLAVRRRRADKIRRCFDDRRQSYLFLFDTLPFLDLPGKRKRAQLHQPLEMFVQPGPFQRHGHLVADTIQNLHCIFVEQSLIRACQIQYPDGAIVYPQRHTGVIAQALAIACRLAQAFAFDDVCDRIKLALKQPLPAHAIAVHRIAGQCRWKIMRSHQPEAVVLLQQEYPASLQAGQFHGPVQRRLRHLFFTGDLIQSLCNVVQTL